MRPPADIESAYGERVKLRARRQAQYHALRDKPCVTKDGHKFALMINAGLTIDLPHLDETGASEQKQMGDVMSALMPKLGGRADGKRVSQMVRERLGT